MYIVQKSVESLVTIFTVVFRLIEYYKFLSYKIYLLYSIQTGYGARPASCPIGAGCKEVGA
jgi:hypothetical protein